MSLEKVALSAYQNILLDTDGTVTDLIRHFTEENIRVTKLTQNIIRSDKPRGLELDSTQQLLHRQILLTGTKHYLFAESFFVIDRMSDFLRRELLESEVPIGLLWQREKLETFREIFEKGVESDKGLLKYFSDLSTPDFLHRSYRVYHGGVPIGLITEKFPLEYFR
jgi:chorismate-pyruvate lyase